MLGNFIVRGSRLPAPDFISAEQTMTVNTVLEIAHSLGAVPTLVLVFGRCKIAEIGYSINDEVPMNHALRGTSDGSNISYDATNITVVQDAAMLFINQTTFAHNNITLANWKLVTKIWR